MWRSNRSRPNTRNPPSVFGVVRVPTEVTLPPSRSRPNPPERPTKSPDCMQSCSCTDRSHSASQQIQTEPTRTPHEIPRVIYRKLPKRLTTSGVLAPSVWEVLSALLLPSLPLVEPPCSRGLDSLSSITRSIGIFPFRQLMYRWQKLSQSSCTCNTKHTVVRGDHEQLLGLNH